MTKLFLIALALVPLLLVLATNQAKADYGCVQEPSTNSTTGPYLCLDKPTESNIWKSPDQLNATGKLHGIPPIYVFLNETVTFTPTHECKLWKMDQAKGFPPYSLSLGDKCSDSLFKWNQEHPDNVVISANAQGR